MSEKKGIKESKELLEGLGEIIASGKKVYEDKKVSIGDLPVFIELLSKYDKISEGFKGLDEIDEEIKDLDEEEAKELVALIFKNLLGK